MFSQVKGENLLSDLNSYFGGADVAPNSQIARLLIQYWGFNGVKKGFEWVVDDLHEFIRRLPKSAMSQVNHGVTSKAMGLMSYLFDFLIVVDDASAWLAKIITTTDNENVRALAAYTFATDQFKDPRYQNELVAAYNNSRKTSCRLAIAFALFIFGERKYLKQHIDNGSLGSPYDYAMYEKIVNEGEPNLSHSDKEMMIVIMLTAPETAGAPSTDASILWAICKEIGS